MSDDAPDLMAALIASLGLPERRAVRHSPWGQDPSGYCGCDDCNAPDDSAE